MKSKAFDIECPGCAGRLKFTLTQRVPVRSRSDIDTDPLYVWPQSAMVRCQACGGVATVEVLEDDNGPDHPLVAIVKFSKLTRG